MKTFWQLQLPKAMDSTQEPLKSDRLSKQLFDACVDGDLPKIKLLIESGAPINDKLLCTSNEKWTVELVEYLFPLFDIRDWNRFGLPFLCSAGKIELIEYLVESGVSTSAMDHWGVVTAINHNKWNIAKYLIEHSVDPPFRLESRNLIIPEHCEDGAVKCLIDLVSIEMKKYTLLSLLNKSKSMHKVLESIVVKKIVKYNRTYQYCQELGK